MQETTSDVPRWFYALVPNDRAASTLILIPLQERDEIVVSPRPAHFSLEIKFATVMKTKNIPIKFRSGASDSTESQKRLKPRHGFPMNARQVLCSFSMMLTERERMALHWLAEGLSAREIARRLQIGDRTVIEARQEIRGGARSFPLAASPGTDNAQDKISRPRQSLARLGVTSTVAGQLNENPS